MLLLGRCASNQTVNAERIDPKVDIVDESASVCDSSVLDSGELVGEDNLKKDLTINWKTICVEVQGESSESEEESMNDFGNSGYISMSFDYPISGVEDTVLQRIRDGINPGQFFGKKYSGVSPADIQKKLKDEIVESPSLMELLSYSCLEIKGEAMPQYRSFLSYKWFHELFFVGAGTTCEHVLDYISFDLRNGYRVSLETLLQEYNISDVKLTRWIKESAMLEGYTQDDIYYSKIIASDNFYFTPDGVFFFYNYESVAKDYSNAELGFVIELMVPWDKFERIVTN